MSVILAIGVLSWVAWHAAYLARHGREDVRFMRAARGWDK